MTTTGTTLAQATRGGAAFVNALVQDIDADQWTRVPVKGMNHPAFIIGHVGYYIDWALSLLGHEDRSVPIDGGDALFAMGVECVEGGEYPDSETLLAWFNGRCEAAADILEQIDDETLAQPNDGGPLAEHLKTVGSEVSFIVFGHTMFHLGQLSAWRRAMGMGRLY